MAARRPEIKPRCAANQRRCKKRSRLPLFKGELAPCGHGARRVEMAEIDAPARDVVGRHLEPDTVAGEDTNAVLPHLAAGVSEDARAVGELDPELRVRKDFLHRPFHFNHVFLSHPYSITLLSSEFLRFSHEPRAKCGHGRALGNDFGTDEEVSRSRLPFDRERLDEALRAEIS